MPILSVDINVSWKWIFNIFLHYFGFIDLFTLVCVYFIHTYRKVYRELKWNMWRLLWISSRWSWQNHKKSRSETQKKKPVEAIISMWRMFLKYFLVEKTKIFFKRLICKIAHDWKSFHSHTHKHVECTAQYTKIKNLLFLRSKSTHQKMISKISARLNNHRRSSTSQQQKNIKTTTQKTSLSQKKLNELSFPTGFFWCLILYFCEKKKTFFLHTRKVSTRSIVRSFGCSVCC